MEVNNISTAYKELHKSASTTADDRFNAYRRLSALDKISLYALSTSSIALIIVSIISITNLNGIKIPEEIKGITDLIQTCIPVLLLAISISVASSNYGARAARMLDSAKKLNSFAKKIHPDIFNSACEVTYLKKCDEYAAIIEQSENHENIDHKLTLINRKKKQEESLEKNQSCRIDLDSKFIAIIKNGPLYFFYLITIILAILWIIFICIKSIKIQ